MVTGKLPFEGRTMAEVLTKVLFDAPALPEAVRPGLSAATSKVISRMMAKDPRRRYPTPEELIHDLDLLIDSLKVGSGEFPANLGMHWRESQRGSILRKRTLLFAGLGLVVVIVAVGFLFFGDGGDSPLSNEPVQAYNLLDLRGAYDAGELSPYQALEELNDMRHDVDSARAQLLKRRILDDCRTILEDLLRPASPRYSQALAEAGFEDGPARLTEIANRDARTKLGALPSNFPPEVQSFWQERLSEARARLLKRIQGERENLLDEANDLLEARLAPIRSMTEAGAHEEAWNALQALRQGAPDLLKAAARRLGEAWAVENLDADRFLDGATLTRFAPAMNKKIDLMEKELEARVREAREEYLDRVKERALALIDAGDLGRMESGLLDLLEEAAREAGPMPAGLPPEADLLLPERDSLMDALEKPFTEPDLLLPERDSLMDALEKPFTERMETLQAERASLFRARLFEDLDALLEKRDYAGALARVDEAEPDSDANRDYLAAWRQSIEKQRDIEGSALKSLADASGLPVSLKTVRGIRYEGEIRQVDRKAALVRRGLCPRLRRPGGGGGAPLVRKAACAETLGPGALRLL
jgi:hypothetical protein